MPRIPRKFVFDPTEVGVYHCINRCVRRAFLWDRSRLRQCFDHRKVWIQAASITDFWLRTSPSTYLVFRL